MSKMLACLFLLLAVPLVHAEESDGTAPLHFCNSHWPPFSYGNDKDQLIGGYAIDFIREISVRIRTPVQLSIMPWLRCLSMAKKGLVDGIMLLTPNDERRQFLHFTEPLLSDANLLWYRADNPHVADRRSFDELKGLRIGVVSGFNYGEAFKQAREDLKLDVEPAPSVRSNFLRLERGWIDVFLVNRVVADYNLLSRPDIRALLVSKQGPFEQVGFHVGLAKAGKGATLLEQFNTAISDMKRAGVIDIILHNPPQDAWAETP